MQHTPLSIPLISLQLVGPLNVAIIFWVGVIHCRGHYLNHFLNGGTIRVAVVAAVPKQLCIIARIMRSASSSMLSAPRPKFILFPSFRLGRMRPHRHRRRRLPFPRHVQTAQMVGHRSCYVPSYWRDVAHCNSYTFCVWRRSHRDSDYSRKKDVHHRNT